MKKFLFFLSAGLYLLASCTPAPKADSHSCCKDAKDSMQVVMNIPRKVLPEAVAGFKASFEKCKVSTLLEPGCLDYGMFQSYTDSTEFVIVETWANKGEHLKHMETAHLKTHLEEIKGMGDSSFRKKMANIYVCPCVNE